MCGFTEPPGQAGLEFCNQLFSLEEDYEKQGLSFDQRVQARLELSNNRVERSVRPFALGRKNWLFSNTPKGADASVAIYSIVETAKANGLKPFAYLNFLLVRLANGAKMEECLPWTSLAQNLCKS